MDYQEFRLGNLAPLSTEQLFELAKNNRQYRIERHEPGKLRLLPTTHGLYEPYAFNLQMMLDYWSTFGGGGYSFDGTHGYSLGDRIITPDLAWFSKANWESLPEADRKAPYPPCCPDMVVEFRHGTMGMAFMERRMEEWQAHGARLAWLFDVNEKKVFEYTPGAAVQVKASALDDELVGGEVMPDFTLELKPFFDTKSDDTYRKPAASFPE